MPATYPDGRQCYLDLADELSGDADFLAEADPRFVTVAREWAGRVGAQWPPEPDLDKALDHVRQREAQYREDTAWKG